MTAPERKGLRRVWVSIYDSGAVGGIWHDAISQRPVAQIGHDFAEYTRSDLADAAVAAALERAILAATSLADGRDEAEFIEREIRRALATDTQTDALEQVRKEAERAGYEWGVREALDIIGIYDESSDCPYCCDVAAINEKVTALLDKPTPDPDEQTEAARELAFRKAVSS